MPPGPFIILSEVDSTNNYAMAKLHAGLVQAGSCFQAVSQTSGKGQRGRQWVAPKGQNITMSVCLKPVHVEFPFVLSAAMALGCYKFIKELGLNNVSVKWPNDVYIGDRKTAGMLIENIVRGRTWEWAIVGIGINVNQTEFGALENKATSLKKALENTPASAAMPPHVIEVGSLGRQLHRHLLTEYDRIQHESASDIMRRYNEVLYRRNDHVRLKKDSATFTTTIDRVTVAGELITRDNIERTFRVGEVEFV